MIEEIKPLVSKLYSFAHKRSAFSRPPKLFLKKDVLNAKGAFGKTAFYDPGNESITLYVHGRHVKDVLRSFSHELVHHLQNLRGDLSASKCGKLSGTYAQDNDHMRNMEKEAYLDGNLCFRDWEDSCKFSVAENKILKENKIMTTKKKKTLNKEILKRLIERILAEKTKRDGHQVAGRDIPKDRVKPLEEEEQEDTDSNNECDEMERDEMGDCPDKIMVAEEAAGCEECGKEPCACAVSEATEEDEPCKTCPDLQEESIEESSKIFTPEKENLIYGNRFAKRNTDLFERLLKKWTK